MTVEARLLEIVAEVARLERGQAARLTEAPIEVEIVDGCRPGLVDPGLIQRAAAALGRVRIFVGAVWGGAGMKGVK